MTIDRDDRDEYIDAVVADWSNGVLYELQVRERLRKAGGLRPTEIDEIIRMFRTDKSKGVNNVRS